MRPLSDGSAHCSAGCCWLRSSVSGCSRSDVCEKENHNEASAHFTFTGATGRAVRLCSGRSCRQPGYVGDGRSAAGSLAGRFRGSRWPAQHPLHRGRRHGLHRHRRVRRRNRDAEPGPPRLRRGPVEQSSRGFRLPDLAVDAVLRRRGCRRQRTLSRGVPRRRIGARLCHHPRSAQGRRLRHLHDRQVGLGRCRRLSAGVPGIRPLFRTGHGIRSLLCRVFQGCVPVLG